MIIQQHILNIVMYFYSDVLHGKQQGLICSCPGYFFQQNLVLEILSFFLNLLHQKMHDSNLE